MLYFFFYIKISHSFHAYSSNIQLIKLVATWNLLSYLDMQILNTP